MQRIGCLSRQAFGWGSSAYGVQLHLEGSPELAVVVETIRTHSGTLLAGARTLFDQWVNACGSVRVTSR